MTTLPSRAEVRAAWYPGGLRMYALVCQDCDHVFAATTGPRVIEMFDRHRGGALGPYFTECAMWRTRQRMRKDWVNAMRLLCLPGPPADANGVVTYPISGDLFDVD